MTPDATTGKVVTLVLPGTPPSFNAIGLHSHWSEGRRAKQQWQKSIETMLLVEKVPRPLASARCSASLQFNVRRRRDEGNFKVLIEKALGDALVNGGWLTDDTPGFYTFGAVDMEVNRGFTSQTRIVIAYSL